MGLVVHVVAETGAAKRVENNDAAVAIGSLSDAHDTDARSADDRPGLQRPELGAHGIVQTLDDGPLIGVDRLVRQGPVFVAET